MVKPAILCIDDQRDVLAALGKELDPLSEHFELVEAESAEEARALLDELEAAGQPVALIVADHVMPGTSGVDFLAELHRDGRFPFTRKLLLTGLATHADTIRAINDARIDRYVAKPWDAEQLRTVVRQLVTHFVLDHDPDDYARFREALDGEVMWARMRGAGG